jgi:hypothetical protein
MVTCWRCPEGVVIFSVVDLDMPLPLVLVWRRDDTSPLLENFIASHPEGTRTETLEEALKETRLFR